MARHICIHRGESRKAKDSSIRVGEKAHVGHMTAGGAGVVGTVTKIDGDYIWMRNEEGRLFRGLLKNATRAKDTKDTGSKEELKRKLDKLQAEIEKAEDRGNGPSREQLKERERLQKAIREVKDASSFNAMETAAKQIMDLSRKIRDHVSEERRGDAERLFAEIARLASKVGS